MEKDSKISIHDLAAGSALNEVNTDTMPHPYAPAEAKPIHLLSSVETEGHMFFSEIIGDSEATTPSIWCINGRDGVGISDWKLSVVSNAECNSFSYSVSELAVSLKV